MTRQATRSAARYASSGFTLIELMISLLIGLLVVAAAGAIFVSNKQTYVATESLGRVQESARVAFEIMARDLREAGGNPCDRSTAVANIVNTPATRWWTDWGNGLRGYGSVALSGLPFGTAAGERVSGTDAVEMKFVDAGVSLVSHQHATSAFTVDVATPANGLTAGDLAIVCDFSHATLFEVTTATGTSIGHAAAHGAAGSPGNCTSGLGLPVTCGGAGNVYIYPKNSVIARVGGARWYVGNNDRGGRSLFREALRGTTTNREEVVDGVTGMALSYLVPDASGDTYKAASSVTAAQWAEVRAIRIVIQLQGQERVGPGGERITRELAYVAALRNRNS